MKYTLLSILFLLSGLIINSTVNAEVIFNKKGATWKSTDGNMSLRLGGRIHQDYVSFDDDVTKLDDDNETRRFRIYLDGRLGKNWQAKVDRDISGTNTGWKNVYLRYRGFDRTKITLGNQVAPFSLENVSSSNRIKFIERSLMNPLTTRFNLGGTYAKYSKKNWTLAGGIYFDDLDDQNNRSNESDGAITARFTYAPIRKKNKVFHLGISTEYNTLDDDENFSISARPEVGIIDRGFVRTRNIQEVDTSLGVGGEVAWARRSFLAQAEYVTRDVARGGDSDLTFDGWYLQAAWAITGERQRYSKKSGIFKSIKPKNSWGAVELAARLSEIDLDDNNVDGGEQQNFTLGVNWYINENIRLMANYIWMDVDQTTPRVDEEPEAFLARFQIAF